MAKFTRTPPRGVDPSEAESARSLQASALDATRADDLEAARDRLARAVDIEPRDAKAWVNYAAVCGELGLADEAARAADRALELDPESREAASNMGVIRRESGRLEEAAAIFRALIARSPEFVFAYYNLAHTLFLDGQFKGAADAYREGLERDPERTANQNARLAWALAAAGDALGAKRELKRALERLAPEEAAALVAEATEVLDGIEALNPSSKSSVGSLRGMVARFAARTGLR